MSLEFGFVVVRGGANTAKFAPQLSRGVFDTYSATSLRARSIRLGVDRDRNATRLEHLEWLAGLATFGLGRISFHADTAPSLSFPVKQSVKTPMEYGGGGGN
ncbi:MAG: hypothetical protein WCS42_15785 [Verrucomicrobiota bacterium]